jgi:hypothetical protein
MGRRLVLAGLAVAAWAGLAAAQSPDGAQESLAQHKLNPLAHSLNLPVTLSFGFARGADAQPTLNFQPLIPFGLTGNWRVVSRSNVPIVHLPGAEGATRLADADVSLFLTPTHAAPLVWGVGPIIQLPTASDPALGTEKWSAGPTAVLVYAAGPWVNGILASHRWSFAGSDRREPVSLTQIEVKLSYAFANDWYVQSDQVLSHDWRAPRGQRWTIPIGVDVGRTFKIGVHGMSLQLGAYYNVKKPTGGADWTLQTQLSWLH